MGFKLTNWQASTNYESDALTPALCAPLVDLLDISYVCVQLSNIPFVGQEFKLVSSYLGKIKIRLGGF